MINWNGRKPRRGEFSNTPNITLKPGRQHPDPSKRMNPQEACLWNAMLSYDYGKGEIYVSDQTLADDLGISRRQVIRHRQSLHKKGFLSWKQHHTDKNLNSYSLFAPDIKPPQTVTCTSQLPVTCTSQPPVPEMSQEENNKNAPNSYVTTKMIVDLLTRFSVKRAFRVPGDHYQIEAADHRIARQVLKTYTAPQIATFFDCFYNDRNELVRLDYSFGRFITYLDKYIHENPKIAEKVGIKQTDDYPT